MYRIRENPDTIWVKDLNRLQKFWEFPHILGIHTFCSTKLTSFNKYCLPSGLINYCCQSNQNKSDAPGIYSMEHEQCQTNRLHVLHIIYIDHHIMHHYYWPSWTKINNKKDTEKISRMHYRWCFFCVHTFRAHGITPICTVAATSDTKIINSHSIICIEEHCTKSKRVCVCLKWNLIHSFFHSFSHLHYYTLALCARTNNLNESINSFRLACKRM